MKITLTLDELPQVEKRLEEAKEILKKREDVLAKLPRPKHSFWHSSSLTTYLDLNVAHAAVHRAESAVATLEIVIAALKMTNSVEIDDSDNAVSLVTGTYFE